jgi:hypothetical protein
LRDLTPILDHLRMSRAKFVYTAEEIPADRWRESPGSGAWSAGEVIAHVTMVERRVMAGAKKTLQSPPAPVPLLKRIHRPVALAAWRGFKLKTPIPLDPDMVSGRPEALDRLDAARLVTLEFIDSTRGQDLSLYRFPHPFLGSLHIYDWFRLLGYHELRHAKQIREVVEIFRR